MSINVTGNGPQAKLKGTVVGGGGGGKHLFVTFTKHEDGTYSCDCTYEQVCDAVEKGYDVIAVHDSTYANLTYKNETGVMFSAAYPVMQFGSGAYQMDFATYVITRNNDVAKMSERCYLLPPVNSDNEDMIMVVEGGAWNMVRRPATRIDEVDLYADKWVGTESPYSQVVSLEDINENCQVDLTPSVEQLTTFYDKDIGLVAENDDGVVTVYAIGQKPTQDYTIQVTITEVDTR